MKDRREVRKTRILRRRISWVVTAVGMFGLVGTVGSIDLDTVLGLSYNNPVFQILLFGLLVVVGLKFTDIFHYHYDIESGRGYYR